jgi:hypothetical protein
MWDEDLELTNKILERQNKNLEGQRRLSEVAPENLRLLAQAWAEGMEAGGHEEAKRRMEAKYRELNPQAEELPEDLFPANKP